MDTKTDTNPPNVCARCKGAGANVYGGGVWSHHFWRDCIEHLTARVEAAEVERNIAARRAFNAEVENQRLTTDNRRLSARVAELEATLASDAADENQWLDAYIESAAKDGATIKRLMARVAELEAAQQWRPVTEKPEKPGWYSVYDSDGHVFYNADIFPYRVARWTGKWDSAFNGLIDYWCPLPPAPQEPTP